MREAEEIVLPLGMSSAGASPGLRFFRPGFPSRAGPYGSKPAWWSFASSRIRTWIRSNIVRNRSGSFPFFFLRASQVARRTCSGNRLVLLAQGSPSSVSTVRQVPHDVGGAQGVDDVGNQEMR